MHDDELAAAQAVQRVIGGTWEATDTGERSGQVDFIDDGRTVALEVTSRAGAADLREAKTVVRKRAEAGAFAGDTLAHLWHVTLPAGTRISTLDVPEIEATLRDCETLGLEAASMLMRGQHGRDHDLVAQRLARLGVESAVLWNETPPLGEPKILIGFSFSVIGEVTSLPRTLAQVLALTDNQDKLAAVVADERHLYVLLQDRAAASGLRGIWSLPECPPDPRGVIDYLWVFAPWASSAYLHSVVPGTDRWEHFVMATGDAAPETT
jgi:hypothetical protein